MRSRVRMEPHPRYDGALWQTHPTFRRVPTIEALIIRSLSTARPLRRCPPLTCQRCWAAMAVAAEPWTCENSTSAGGADRVSATWSLLKRPTGAGVTSLAASDTHPRLLRCESSTRAAHDRSSGHCNCSAWVQPPTGSGGCCHIARPRVRAETPMVLFSTQLLVPPSGHDSGLLGLAAQRHRG